MYRDVIKKALQEVTELDTVRVDVPAQDSFGDYSSNIALQIKGKNPRETAEELKKKLESHKELMEITEKIDIAGSGFLNFWIKEAPLIDNLNSIQAQRERYGTLDIGKGKTVVIDYSAPTIAK